MRNRIIRDRNGKMIARLDIMDHLMEPCIRLYNRDGIYQGQYREKINQTFDRNGKMVGFGNLLMTLLQNK